MTVARNSTSMRRSKKVERSQALAALPQTPSVIESANAHQVGGVHYRAHGRSDLQHWDVVAIFGLDYFQGCITKYLFRWRDKNGVEDLIKARHYLDKYIELQQQKKA
jgi:hypothetical protein